IIARRQRVRLAEDDIFSRHLGRERGLGRDLLPVIRGALLDRVLDQRPVEVAERVPGPGVGVVWSGFEVVQPKRGRELFAVCVLAGDQGEPSWLRQAVTVGGLELVERDTLYARPERGELDLEVRGVVAQSEGTAGRGDLLDLFAVDRIE